MATTDVQSPTCPSSTRGEQDHQSTSDRASYSSAINETYGGPTTGTLLTDCLADMPVEYIKHKKSQDLLGLILKDHDGGILDSNIPSPQNVVEQIPQEQIIACPVHGALLRKLQGTTSHLLNPVQGMSMTPMGRYVAEGLEVRYALMNLSKNGTDMEWARYSGCLCGPDRLPHNSDDCGSE